jgi:hypothetical protein
MPKVALAESLSDWEALIANASAHACDIPELGQKLEALRAVLEHAKATYARQQELEGERRQVTQDLAEDKERGRQLAMLIRSFLRGIYGPNHPRLPSFGMKARPLAKGDSSPKPIFKTPEPEEQDTAPELE